MTADEGYDALVYDLDGTLVRLAVDWGAVARDVANVLEDRGIEIAEVDLWHMLEVADETGHRYAVEEAIADHEREGARTSERLPMADALPHPIPVGVCSLNCEAACRLALATHGLAGAIDAVVGRDSVGSEKPHPEPLLATVRSLETPPERTLFVGDSERDRETAARAGVPFEFVSDRLARGAEDHR